MCACFLSIRLLCFTGEDYRGGGGALNFDKRIKYVNYVFFQISRIKFYPVKNDKNRRGEYYVSLNSVTTKHRGWI